LSAQSASLVQQPNRFREFQTGDANRGNVTHAPAILADIRLEEASILKFRQQLVRESLQRPFDEYTVLGLDRSRKSDSASVRLFGLSPEEMQKMLAEDAAENRAIFEEMFGASFLHRPPEKFEND
jgi:hypothetical protein